MDVKELAGEYALKADEELLLLAAGSKELIPEAQAALAEELAKRGIQPPEPQPVAPQCVLAPMRVAVPSQQVPLPRGRQEASSGWQVLWFFLHLVVVYIGVMFLTWRIAFLAYSLRFAIERTVTTSPIDFLVAHLFFFTFVPGFLLGAAFARFNVKAAMYVVLVPAAILAFRIASFPVEHGSVLFGQAEFHWWSGFPYYFGTNPAEGARAFAQIGTMGPFYAAGAYTSGAIVAAELRLHDAIDHAFADGQGMAP